MSITGAADGPPYRLGVAIVDIVSGHVRRAGRRAGAVRARAHRTRPGGGHRDARCGRRAAHLPGRDLLRDRHGAGAAGQPPPDASCRTRRSRRRTASSCSRSATTISGAGSARSPGSPDEPRFATNRQRVTGYDELQPFVADRLRTEPRQYWIERLTAAGVPCGSVRNFAGAVRRSAARRARDDRPGRARHDRRSCRCSACRSSCPTRRDRSARRRRRSASTPTRCSNRISGFSADADRRASRADRRSSGRRSSLMEISDVREAPEPRPSSARSGRRPSGGRAATRRRARSTTFLDHDRRAAVPAGRQRPALRRLPVHRLHAVAAACG